MWTHTMRSPSRKTSIGLALRSSKSSRRRTRSWGRRRACFRGSMSAQMLILRSSMVEMALGLNQALSSGRGARVSNFMRMVRDGYGARDGESAAETWTWRRREEGKGWETRGRSSRGAERVWASTDTSTAATREAETRSSASSPPRPRLPRRRLSLSISPSFVL